MLFVKCLIHLRFKNSDNVRIRFYILILISILFGAKLAKSQDDSIFTKNVFINTTGDTLLYRFLKPMINECDDTLTKYPLVIFLHGAGERGNDNELQITQGVNVFSQPEMMKKFPCYLIAPQCPEGKRWVEVDWDLPSHKLPAQISISLKLTMQLVDKIISNKQIDKNRIYITGLSMGGFGTWDLISRYPDFFAAAVPVCGGGDEHYSKEIKDVPIWAFHGAKDKLVTVNRSRNMIKSIKNSGGTPKYTEYQNLGHLCWGKAYSEPELLKWIFSQSKK